MLLGKKVTPAKKGGKTVKKAAAKLAFFDDSEEDGDEETEDALEGDGADDAGEMLRRIMEQYQSQGGYTESPEAPADAPLYGGGKGLKGKSKAPKGAVAKVAAQLGLGKRADAQSQLTGYEDRAAKRAPRRPAPPPPTSAQQQGWAGASMGKIKPPPAPKVRTAKDLQAGAASLDGPDAAPAPKPQVATRAVKPPAPPR